MTTATLRPRRILSGVATLPAALPPLVGVLAFLFLYGESGVVTRAVQHVLGLKQAPWTFTGLSAVIIKEVRGASGNLVSCLTRRPFSAQCNSDAMN